MRYTTNVALDMIDISHSKGQVKYLFLLYIQTSTVSATAKYKP